MSALRERAEEYLKLRRALGYDLADAARLLPRFVDHLEQIGAESITREAALAWVLRPDADATSSVWARRMAAVRGFARHMSGIDTRTEVPPLGLVTFRTRWRPPFIYSSEDVQALMSEATRTIPTPFRAATYTTLIGLLGATGLRVGEAIRLSRNDVDFTEAVVVVRASKFKKSREVPVASSTAEALADYAHKRNHWQPVPKVSAFFTSTAGTAVHYEDFGKTFRKLIAMTGVGATSSSRPRIHDLRHSFAVQTLIGWYRSGQDVGALLPRLSTYMGHRDPTSTYWYLSAVPDLLALAAARLQTSQQGRP
jgi:integrase